MAIFAALVLAAGIGCAVPGTSGPAADFREGLASLRSAATPGDTAAAARSLHRAAEAGHAEAQGLRDELKQRMSSSEVARAQRLSREWYETRVDPR